MSAAAQGEAHSVGHRRLTVTGGARLGSPVDTHGLNRRPSRADLTPIDPAAIEAYTAGVERAVRANRHRVSRENQLDGGYWWAQS